MPRDKTRRAIKAAQTTTHPPGRLLCLGTVTIVIDCDGLRAPAWASPGLQRPCDQMTTTARVLLLWFTPKLPLRGAAWEAAEDGAVGV